MFPIHRNNAGFTYDNLSEIRPDPLWISLATTLAAAFLVVVALAASEQPPVQADAPGANLAYVAPAGAEHADEAIAAP